MLQNKSTLIFLWLLIFVFIGFLFLRNDDSKENEAVLRSIKLLKNYDKEILDKTEYEIEQNILDQGNNLRDRKILDLFRENRVFLDSINKIATLDWATLLGQLVQSSKDSTYYKIKDLDSQLYFYSKSSSKPIFSIHQNLLYHYYMIILDDERNKFGFGGNRFGDYLQIGLLDSTLCLTATTPIYTNFIIEPHFDKPKYYSTNFIFDKDSVIRFQAVTYLFIDGEKNTQTKYYEIVPKNGKIMSPFSYKEIK
ncbi:hypothetical protein ACE193_07615 [Bernardetia sp. OM2101]|uniref:hypothetical protein n=1 Tax=Bernardetia sp. OM2101 TaxID=3344876 RepID=UPI0035D0A3DE